MQVSIQDIEQYAAATEGVEQICKLLVQYNLVEMLSLGHSFESEKTLEGALVDFYEAILRYLLKAQRYFAMSSASMYFRSMVLPQATRTEYDS